MIKFCAFTNWPCDKWWKNTRSNFSLAIQFILVCLKSGGIIEAMAPKSKQFTVYIYFSIFLQLFSYLAVECFYWSLNFLFYGYKEFRLGIGLCIVHFSALLVFVGLNLLNVTWFCAGQFEVDNFFSSAIGLDYFCKCFEITRVRQLLVGEKLACQKLVAISRFDYIFRKWTLVFQNFIASFIFFVFSSKYPTDAENDHFLGWVEQGRGIWVMAKITVLLGSW